jgi:hypothetical protein
MHGPVDGGDAAGRVHEGTEAMTEQERTYLFMGEQPEKLDRCRIYDGTGGTGKRADWKPGPCVCESGFRRQCFLRDADCEVE